MNGYRESTVCTLIQPDGYTSSAQTPHALDTAPLLRASLCVRGGAHVCILMWKTEINRSVVRMLFLTRWSESQNLCVCACERVSVCAHMLVIVSMPNKHVARQCVCVWWILKKMPGERAVQGLFNTPFCWCHSWMRGPFYDQSKYVFITMKRPQTLLRWASPVKIKDTGVHHNPSELSQQNATPWSFNVVVTQAIRKDYDPACVPDVWPKILDMDIVSDETFYANL